MPTLIRILPAMVIAFALLALALGLYERSHPPFTDEQIKASLTHTWEVAASTTRVFGIVFLGLGMICATLAHKSSGPPRLTAWLAATLCLLTLALFLHNHITLTTRVTDLTNHQFGTLYGLL